MEEEEDRNFLSSLGVTSFNPEDIERSILAEETNNVDLSDEEERNKKEGPSDKSEKIDEIYRRKKRLYSKLKAVNFEIDAIASTVDAAKIVEESKGNCQSHEKHDVQNQAGQDGYRIGEQTSCYDSTLHKALVEDRLRSLRVTKAQLEEDLSQFLNDNDCQSIAQEALLQDLVKEEPRLKRRLKSEKKIEKGTEKRQKAVLFSDDADFDATLDAASAGFVETERDKLVKRGVLTPFHKLKGFERRVQQSGDSITSVDRRDHDASGSLERAAKSFSEAANSRPSTKLVDPECLPKLDGPTCPFQRFKIRSKARKNVKTVTGTRMHRGKKMNRPMPEQKYRKSILREDSEQLLEGETDNLSGLEEEASDEFRGNELPFVTLEGGLKIPNEIFNKLFDYQKVGVQWLWELHCQRAGGIIGDEMGLGKTVQVLAFLGALHFSGMYGPSIIVCPVTLLRQWKREAKTWYRKFQVELLHDSAQVGSSQKKRTDRDSDSESISLDSEHEETNPPKATKWDSLINRVLKSKCGLLVTTYEQLRLHSDKLLDVEWGYAVLDEGHRIRNPNADTTLTCKQLQTVHRIIMTGAPIQNRLTELWSLFDFVFPGKLGVLPVFEAEFAVPISIGGYANASPIQVSTAYRCAVVLRDLVMPYLLRRLKSDVNAQLPKKSEHVLFCSLTSDQRLIYRSFLASSDVEQILEGNRNSLYGIDVMRKICNHPDLLERELSHQDSDYGNPERSGKMKVLAEILKVWQGQGHRVLLFAQTQQMLDILEKFVIANDYSYRRMDGSTAVKQRMALIDEFNDSTEVFIFILTTKVGGLGTNLTGANRVIIYDPDWNPSTDMQARERAWRIGQKKDVTVYRLITRGTIEEKVYHRQIYKHFLTNKILKNPRQKRFFKARDMKDLFTLSDNGEGGSTETSNIFSHLDDDLNVINTESDNHKRGKDPLIDAVPCNDDNRRVARSSTEKCDVESGTSDVSENGETVILKRLFDGNGIHSAVNHDAIMNANGDEKMWLEEQASQVAQRAAEALRQSQMLRRCDDVSVPTWTGKLGAAGAPPSVRRKFGSKVNHQLTRSEEISGKRAINTDGIAAGASSGKALSSTDLLARIRANKHNSDCSVASTSSHSSSQVGSEVQPEVLIRQICTFIQREGGSIDSTSIVQHFRDRIPSKSLPLFKNLLKEIATLETDQNGKVWVLKPEFRSNNSFGNG